MAQLLLIVRQVEDELVKKHKEMAGKHGVSMGEKHRSILREVLLGKKKKRRSLKEALLVMPNVGEDADFARDPQLERPIDL